MPTFLDGQMNLAALTVPGVYVDVVLPQPNLLGTPTNFEALVGVGSWGTPNTVIQGSKPNDVALSIGPPVIRSSDIASYVAASSEVGGAIGYLMVRVTDGTDTAASATINSGITLTGKCTGTLGNKITFSMQNGTLANSYVGIVSFPGRTAEQFNNVLGPVPASATAAFSANPSANDTLTIGGSAVTFVASGATGLQVNIGTSLAVTLASLLSFLQGSADTNLVKFAYAIATNSNTLTITANQFASSGTNAGAAGNSLTLAKSSTAITVSGTTLSGGTGSWQTFWTNLAAAINNGNAYSGASLSVIATANTSTTPPVLSAVTTLSGGTDGASGVTDATLVGQDVLPRKGMYALRNSLADCFTLCDLATPADYAAIASFALSENMYAVQVTPSGDSILGAAATRINAGVDTPWFKLIQGNWPSFYDSYNGVTRLINPAAFALGIYGNLSPQMSALNKPLLGVTATQMTQIGQIYSDADLSAINSDGIDAIIGPQQSPGGYYFSFASGRNASSNTAANGDEYTRMTNFLARAAKSKAAGSFIGQLQSIQPNDQTRAKAKALFDGFSAQLAAPQFGTGINGQGMIDSWSTQCDLNNNPPNLQALGYLFLYWTVRYLNVTRYFVVKLNGGGNVTVSVQSTPPNPAQFAQAINTAA